LRFTETSQGYQSSRVGERKKPEGRGRAKGSNPLGVPNKSKVRMRKRGKTLGTQFRFPEVMSTSH